MVRSLNINQRVSPRDVSTVCSLSDPFCHHAKTGKYPDNSQRSSLNFQTRALVSIGSDPNGSAACLIVPHFEFHPVVFGTISANTATWGTASARTSGVTPSAYRLISMGIIVRPTGSALNASGLLLIRGWPRFGPDIGTTDLTSFYADFSETVALSKCNEVCAIMRKNGPTSNMWTKYVTPVNTNPGDLGDFGWGAISVAVLGGQPSNAAFSIEVIQNYELTFADDNSMNMVATQSPVANILITQATDAVYSTGKSVFLQGVSQATAWVAKRAAAAIAGAFLGPSGAMAARGGLAIMVD